MNQGLEITLDLLATTPNEAAVRALEPALDSPIAAIREGALRAILKRRGAGAQREVLRRLDRLDASSRAIVAEYGGRLTQAARDALLSPDPGLCANGCRAAVWFRQYDLIPVLVSVLENTSSPHRDLAGATLLELVSLLYGELAAGKAVEGHRDPELARCQAVVSLERSVARFSGHRRREALEAYLLLVPRDNAVLRQVLEDPHHAAFLTLVEVLSKSTAPGIMGLLLSLVDDPRVPTAALSVIGKRRDLTFLGHLLRKIGREPSGAVKHNLKRMQSVVWLEEKAGILDRLDAACQHAAVQVAMASGISRDEAFAVVKHLLMHGKPAGRRAAARALNEFSGAEANALVLAALDDHDPQVQAIAVAQLRRRGIVGALPRLVEMVDSPHPIVRRAARESLDEFTFERFVAAFDMLDEDVRLSTGALVKKVDPQTIPQLKAELESNMRSRRLRGLKIARVIDAVQPVEAAITRLMQDDDHLVRAEAAAALGRGCSAVSWEALEKALDDPSGAVREAARESLHRRARPVPAPMDFDLKIPLAPEASPDV